MKHWFHCAVTTHSLKLGNTETYKEFHAGGVAKTTDVAIHGNAQTKTATPQGTGSSTYTGPTGNTVTYTLFDVDPRTTHAAVEKARLTATFGNANNTVRQGIHSLEIAIAGRGTRQVAATDDNQPRLQGLFDRVKYDLSRSYDLGTALGKLASAYVDLDSITANAKPGAMPCRAFRAVP
ncbi:MAG TPA: hypothetical protein PKX87_03775 [Alphaproteobacteria bacterium]|nr:hypothetical protein [Alphaproteobacteria bacterium]